MKQFKFLMLIILGMTFFGCQPVQEREKKVLVFSKTEGYRHTSISAGKQAIIDMGARDGFKVDTSEHAGVFNQEDLAQYSAVVFLNTTMDILNYQQQSHFERYIQAGGGFVGIHAAADTEYDWPWYGKLVGAYFNGHPSDPNVREATCDVIDHGHIASDSLPDSFQKIDEFYNYKNINPNLNVLVTIDETTYEGGTNGDFHPMTWYHEFDGGRAFYTGFGHTDETYNEPEFLEILSGGIEYAIGDASPLDYSLARYEPMPDEDRFTKVVLDYNLYEPLELAVLPDGRVLFIERRGNLKMYKPDLDSTILIQKFDVYLGIGRNGNHEDGLLGLALDPDIANNNWVYIYYSPQGDDDVQNLSRFELTGDELLMDSEIVMLQVGVQRLECCHTGGSIQFGPDGNLFLSTGDDTNPFKSDGFSPGDERPGRSPWDAQKSASNANDLRGKILRITPQPDGSYTIPEGNLFPPGTPDTRPEIYVMGCRNPYRIAIDHKSGFLYWGDVGPDARADSDIRGPRGIDEFNQAREAGFFGWPYFTGNNLTYAKYDFQNKTTGTFHDPQKPINNSPNNTGIEGLPPTQEAFIYYDYGESEQWPILGTGGRTAMAGPIYYGENYPDDANKYPRYFDGKVIFYEWIRSKIYFLTLNENGDLEKIEPFMPNVEFNNPMDMEYGSDGKLYMLEYGTGWNTQNVDARLVRIDYQSGNRNPIVHISANKVAGATPLKVQFSSTGSEDYDDDPLSYHWEFHQGATSEETNPEFTFQAPGIYRVKLTLSDPDGGTASETVEIQVGNEPPKLAFEISGNQTFYWDDRQIDYEVNVSDLEEGSLSDGNIDPKDVMVTVEYLEEASKETIKGHIIDDEEQHLATGPSLIAGSDCKACHAPEKKSVGPSYVDISNKYRKEGRAVATLVNKVIKGGSGVWGETPMAAHPSISLSDARKMVQYILSFGEEGSVQSLPVKGSYTTTNHQDKGLEGVYILKAVYTDKGGEVAGPASGQQLFALRNTQVKAVDFDSQEGVQIFKNDEAEVVLWSDPSFISFENIDLSDMGSLTLSGFAMGTQGAFIEIRLDGPTGSKIAETTLESTGIELQQGRFAVQATVQLEKTVGIHDIYITAKSKTPGSPVGGLSTITFNPR